MNNNERKEEQKMLKLELLNSTEFQKEIRKDHVRNIFAGFVMALFYPIEVAFYNNQYIVWDGQHRIEIAKLLGHTEIKCNIKYGLTYSEIISLYLAANKKNAHTQTKPMENYKAALCIPEGEIEEVIKNDEIIRINKIMQKIVEKYDVRLYGSGRINRNGEYNSVHCPDKLFSIIKDKGEKNLDTTFLILKDGLGIGTGAFQADFIVAMSDIINEYNLNTQRMINKLMETSVKEIEHDIGKYKSNRKYNRVRSSDICRAIFMKLYDEGLSKKERLESIRLVA